VIGVVENMKMSKSKTTRQKTRKLGVKFLGEIPYDPKVEETIGNADKLLGTTLAKKVEQIASEI
jgi:MinD superfamily P-loop ATPase